MARVTDGDLPQTRFLNAAQRRSHRLQLEQAQAEYLALVRGLNASTSVDEFFGAIHAMRAAFAWRENADARLPISASGALDVAWMAVVADHQDDFLAALENEPCTATDLAAQLAIDRRAVALSLYYLDKLGVVERTKRGREYHCVLRSREISPGSVEQAWAAVQPTYPDEASSNNRETFMSLIRCPECNTEVSSLAAACPKCAAPIAHSDAAKAVGQGVTTTEVTSKTIKKRRLVSVALIVLGLIFFAGGGQDNTMRAVGAFAFLGGIIYFIVVSFQKWWHHG